MDMSPVAKYDIEKMNNDAIVYDVIYNPQKTLLLQYAEECGLKTVNGLDMLIHQGAKALEIWTGKMPDVQTMKIAALQAL